MMQRGGWIQLLVNGFGEKNIQSQIQFSNFFLFNLFKRYIEMLKNLGSIKEEGVVLVVNDNNNSCQIVNY